MISRSRIIMQILPWESASNSIPLFQIWPVLFPSTFASHYEQIIFNFLYLFILYFIFWLVLYTFYNNWNHAPDDCFLFLHDFLAFFEFVAIIISLIAAVFHSLLHCSFAFPSILSNYVDRVTHCSLSLRSFKNLMKRTWWSKSAV